MYVCNVRFPTAALMDRTTIAELSGADSHRHDFCRFLPCAMDAAGCGKLKYLTRGSYFLAGNLQSRLSRAVLTFNALTRGRYF